MSSPAQAYGISVEVTVAAGRNKVWKSLVKKTGAWWPAAYFSQSTTKRFVIENKLGGRVYEDCGKKSGIIWGTVVGWMPGEKIVFAFEMYPGWGGPGRSIVSITLTDADGGTKLMLEDNGVCPHAEKAAASVKDGWEKLLGTHFKEFVDGGKPKKEKKVKKEKKPKKASAA
jgi:uncharacterized protein YndB with AHSA1/START domain